MKEAPVTEETMMDRNEEARICPYLEIECRPICPGWIEAADACLFNVCMTTVKDSFMAAAKYLDEHLGLIDGVGLDTIKGLREVIDGKATPEQKQIVGSVLGSLISTGVLVKISHMTVGDISSLVSKVESKISFAFDTLFEDE